MLVVHGDKDYRVPIGEGLRLWYELLSAQRAARPTTRARSPHRFLYFPDENHWVLSPQHAVVWYQVVEAFLAQHVLGEEAALPRHVGVTSTPSSGVRDARSGGQTRRSWTGDPERPPRTRRTDMGIGGGIALIVVGAIMSFGVQ